MPWFRYGIDRSLSIFNVISRGSMVLLLLCSGLLFAQAALDATAWSSFLSWARSLPAENFSTQVALEKYRAHLRASGSSADMVEKQITALTELLVHSHTGTLPQQNDWDLLVTDKYYARRPVGQTYPFPPNAFLASVVKNLPPGKSLDCGMGSGRDAIYLATQGWDAHGFDRSGGGIALALENAKKAGVRITTSISEGSDYKWGEEQFDLISNIHSLGLEESVSKIRAALKTGGIYVVELAMLPTMKDRERMPAAYLPNQPLTFFQEGWRILRYEDTPGTGDCAGCRQIEIRTCRIVAQKINPAEWR